MKIYLYMTTKSALSYGSSITGEIVGKSVTHTSVQLVNNLVIRIPNHDIKLVSKNGTSAFKDLF